VDLQVAGVRAVAGLPIQLAEGAVLLYGVRPDLALGDLVCGVQEPAVLGQREERRVGYLGHGAQRAGAEIGQRDPLAATLLAGVAADIRGHGFLPNS
jgi:hypothetical protein